MEAFHVLPGITDVRAMWLLVMGSVLMVVGLFVVMQVVWRQVAPRVAVVLQAMVQPRDDLPVRNGASSPAAHRMTV